MENLLSTHLGLQNVDVQDVVDHGIWNMVIEELKIADVKIIQLSKICLRQV